VSRLAVCGKGFYLSLSAGRPKVGNMTQLTNLLDLAREYQAVLPARIRSYLHERGISDAVIDRYLLGWNGWRITIPITNREGVISFFKLAKDPGDDRSTPKMLTSLGATLELYGWEEVLRKPSPLIVCEGEFDRLVLQTQGFHAVTSTGGAGTFRPEWAADFEGIPELYLCFDRDQAGQDGARRVSTLVPHAKVIELPDEVGEAGDITDFFVRLGRTPEDFMRLLEHATSVPPPPMLIEALPPARGVDSPARERIDRIKQALPIEGLVGRYVALQVSGGMFVGRCPFHDDQVPSLTVYPKTGTFHCYGCRRHGDVIDFLQGIEHVNFKAALDLLEAATTHHGREAA
jgi:DNA primase